MKRNSRNTTEKRTFRRMAGKIGMFGEGFKGVLRQLRYSRTISTMYSIILHIVQVVQQITLAYRIPILEGVDTLRTFRWGVRHTSWNPYPISYQNKEFSLPDFRPDSKSIPFFRPDLRFPKLNRTPHEIRSQKYFLLNYWPECKNHTLSQTKMAKFFTLFQIKAAPKSYL